MKLWNIKKPDKQQAMAIAQENDLPIFLAMLLSLRGIAKPEEIEDFLLNRGIVTDYHGVKDIEKAAARVKKALEQNEKICIYGDYDADGVTATALLFSYLEANGADVTYYIPSRAEGYGLNKDAIAALKQSGVSLIVTVDNGVAAVAEIAYATELGLDVVVTDHHQPQGQLPDCAAVVDLHCEGNNVLCYDMCGVGTTFLLVMAIEGEYCDPQALLGNFADLLCIGTVGDLVPLHSDNRTFVKEGILHIQNSDSVGIAALLEEAGLTGKPLTAGKVAFSIVPRINAVGRLGNSSEVVELLLCEEPERAAELATKFGEYNRTRQELCKTVFDDVMEAIKQNPLWRFSPVIVVSGQGWHKGILGIVAARIKDVFGKPAIVISSEGENAVGSARSVEGFAICDAIDYCADMLTHHGGHPMAAGLSLKTADIEKFRHKVNEYAKKASVPPETLQIDCKLNPAQLNIETAELLQYLEPYGSGNPEPLFAFCNMELCEIHPLSGGKHLKLVLKRESTRVTALKFFAQPQDFPYLPGDIIDIAAKLSINEYKGTKSVSVIIEDIKFSDFDVNAAILANNYFEEYCLGSLTDAAKAAQLLPSREDFAAVYRYIRSVLKFKFTPQVLLHRVGNRLNYGKLMVALQAMAQSGLISFYEPFDEQGSINIEMLPVEGKADLDNCGIIKDIKNIIIE
ncbi:MAG: single-stranded-DNA-specific exonuclease RecJ [Oscillospiraceae bacterium]|jgi:single-stranded-DNA-specific exonuclease|nr:single-stranded-DNA-specific exonuclease RecJ [Oscillospiraceae bacterium]